MKLKLTSPLVKEFISTNAGEHAYKIVRILDKGMTDEQISRKIKIGVNEIRTALNKMHYLGVIDYSKIKAKKTNWYTYTWFLQKERVNELLKNRYEEELDKLNEKLDMHDNHVFFKCKNGCDMLPFELAFEYNFKCPDCGTIMQQQNTNKEQRILRSRAVEIKKLIN